MKLEQASITILVSADGTEMYIRDEKANIDIVRVKLDPVQFSQALSRLAHTKCVAEVFSLDKVGKTHESEKFEFEIDPGLARSSESVELVRLCKLALFLDGREEWVPDSYFGSQSSFIRKDGKTYANATVRRWV